MKDGKAKEMWRTLMAEVVRITKQGDEVHSGTPKTTKTKGGRDRCVSRCVVIKG